MIFDRRLWFPSTASGMFWLLIVAERKRIKAFGGRGMWPLASRFFAPRVDLERGLPVEVQGCSSRVADTAVDVVAATHSVAWMLEEEDALGKGNSSTCVEIALGRGWDAGSARNV